MSHTDIFKECTYCRQIWPERDSFLSDPLIDIIGYSANFEDLHLGLLLFNHIKQDCKTTIAIEAGAFVDLYSGEIFHERKTGSESCPGYCQRKDDLRACTVQCECAYVRDIIQIIKSWPKSQPDAG